MAASVRRKRSVYTLAQPAAGRQIRWRRRGMENRIVVSLHSHDMVYIVVIFQCIMSIAAFSSA